MKLKISLVGLSLLIMLCTVFPNGYAQSTDQSKQEKELIAKQLREMALQEVLDRVETINEVMTRVQVRYRIADVLKKDPRALAFLLKGKDEVLKELDWLESDARNEKNEARKRELIFVLGQLLTRFDQYPKEMKKLLGDDKIAGFIKSQNEFWLDVSSNSATRDKEAGQDPASLPRYRSTLSAWWASNLTAQAERNLQEHIFA
jgi:hypothetical protein